MFTGCAQLSGQYNGNVVGTTPGIEYDSALLDLDYASVQTGYYTAKTAFPEISEKLGYANFTLDGTITVNFYYSETENSTEKIDNVTFAIYDKISRNTTVNTVSRDEYVRYNSTSYAQFSCPISIEQFHSGYVTAVAYTASLGSGKPQTLNINSYVDHVVNGKNADDTYIENNLDMRNVVKYMDLYSCCAQAYEYDSSEESLDTAEESIVSAIVNRYEPKFAYSQEYSGSGSQPNVVTGSYIVLNDSVSMVLQCGDDRFVTKVLNNVNGTDFSEDYTVEYDSKNYKITIPNIPAHCTAHSYSLQFTAVVNNNTVTGSVTCSPMDYLYTVINAESMDGVTSEQLLKLQTLSKSLCLFAYYSDVYLESGPIDYPM